MDRAPTLAQNIQLPDDAEAFCHSHGIENDLRTALTLARRHFGKSELQCEYDVDPETGSSWITINVATRGMTLEQVLDADKKYGEEFVDVIPARSRQFICIYPTFSNT